MENYSPSDKHGLVLKRMEMEMYKNHIHNAIIYLFLFAYLYLSPLIGIWYLFYCNSFLLKPFTWAFIKSFACQTNGIRRPFSHSAFGLHPSHSFFSITITTTTVHVEFFKTFCEGNSIKLIQVFSHKFYSILAQSNVDKISFFKLFYSFYGLLLFFRIIVYSFYYYCCLNPVQIHNCFVF